MEGIQIGPVYLNPPKPDELETLGVKKGANISFDDPDPIYSKVICLLIDYVNEELDKVVK